MSKYTTILHDVRNSLGLTNNEYILLDTIFKLQSKKGYCYSKKLYFAEILGISERAIFKLLDKLFENGFIKKHPEYRNYISVTNKFIKEIIGIEQSSETMNKVQEKTEQSSKKLNKVQEKTEQSSYNNNNILNKDNKTNKEKFDLSIFQNDLIRKKVEEFIEYRKEIKKPYVSQKSIESLKTQLSKLSNNNIDLAIEIINQTIANGWQGLFEIKTNITPKQNGYSTSNLQTLK